MPVQKLKQKALNGSQPIIFSFFSGGGLLDLGFEKEGYEIAFVNEISPSFIKAYKHARFKMGLPEPKFGYFNLDINEFLNGRKSELVSLLMTYGLSIGW